MSETVQFRDEPPASQHENATATGMHGTVPEREQIQLQVPHRPLSCHWDQRILASLAGTRPSSASPLPATDTTFAFKAALPKLKIAVNTSRQVFTYSKYNFTDTKPKYSPSSVCIVFQSAQAAKTTRFLSQSTGITQRRSVQAPPSKI